jgi:hypothetical protein
MAHHLWGLSGTFLLLALPGFAQAPVKVSLCDLIQEPQKYTQQWVEVRGEVRIGFEVFVLRTDDCGDEINHRSVWLSYGGDAPISAASTATNGMRTVPAVTLHRDDNLALFKRRLVAHRTVRPDGSGCYENCPFYRVTATFTGLFLAMQAGSGYGHMGCCHLLMIGQFKEVNAQRTGVPAGGQFACSKDAWELNGAESKEMLRHRPCMNLADCGKAVGEQFGPVAAHWQDKFDADSGTAYNFLSGAPTWTSADLLMTYALAAHYSNKKGHRDDVTGATVTRTSCKATEPPYPMTTPIGCRTLFTHFDGTDKKDTAVADDAHSVESWRGTPESVAPQALEKATKVWGLALLPGLKLESCTQPKVYREDQFAECDWSDPTAMQRISLRLSRSRPLHQLRGWDNVPWRLAWGDGIACFVEGQ